mgnify:CR=1 FL=1
MLATLIAFAATGAAAQHGAPVQPSPELRTYAAESLQVSSFRWAEFDLDGDGRAEQFVYADGADWCGSGGCTLFVLTPAGGQWRQLLRATISWPPIAVLPSRSHGWRDIAVATGGGGARPATARIRFDGRRYRPGNPTNAPHVPRGVRLRVLIDAKP